MIRALALICCAAPAAADTVIALRTIPAQAVILPSDIGVNDDATLGGITDPAVVIGMEARVALFAGRPIREGDITQPAVVERNQIVTLLYDRGGLQISTEGRALSRAAAGEVIRVMNLSSRTTVSARLDETGVAHVQ